MKIVESSFLAKSRAEERNQKHAKWAVVPWIPLNISKCPNRVIIKNSKDLRDPSIHRVYMIRLYLMLNSKRLEEKQSNIFAALTLALSVIHITVAFQVAHPRKKWRLLCMLFQEFFLSVSHYQTTSNSLLVFTLNIKLWSTATICIKENWRNPINHFRL